MSAPPPAAGAFRRQWIWLAALLAVAIGIYLPGLGNLPVFDDAFYSEGALKRFYSQLQLRPRMLSYGTFVWIDALFGESLWKQRIFNVVLHGAVVAALWGFYREVLRAIEPPRAEPGEAPQPYHDSHALGLALAFFALNPVAVYAVAYVIQRSILMATLFVVLGLWLFARGLRTGRVWMHLLAVACYILAVASKEHAILAPLAALPVYILVARPSRRRLLGVAGAGAALIAVAGVILAQRFGNILGAPFDEFSQVYLQQLAALDPNAPRNAWPLSIENQAWLFFEYGVRWFLPVADWMSISMRPPFPVQWMTFPQVLGLPLYIGAIVVASYFLLRTRDWRALAGLCVLLAATLFASEFATVWVQDPFVLYRSYLWAIGVPGLVVCFAHGTSVRALAVITVVVGLLMSWQAVERVLSLETPETAWSDAIRKLPRDARAVGRWFPYLNRGSYYVEHDRDELALRDFEASAQLGDMGMGWFNTGSLMNAKGKPQQALALFDRAEGQGYKLYSLHFQRGLALASLNRTREAQREFELSMLMAPPSPTKEILWLQRGRMALQNNEPDTAIGDLEKYVAYDARHGEARYLLAMAYNRKARYEDALKTLEAVPEGGSVHFARALAHWGLGNKPRASEEIAAAIRLAPPSPVLAEWQAKIRAMPERP